MPSNLDKYKNDLKNLVVQGKGLLNAMQNECYPELFKKEVLKVYKDENKIKELLKALPSFKDKYQNWYSEALTVIKIVLPDRLGDFVRLYEKPKIRKEIDISNYVIEDYLQSITTSLRGEIKVGPFAAIPQFTQQLNILESVQKRFESSLFDIKQLVQADLFDSELGAARELEKNKFFRGAGALAGVVLEKHLHQVCDNHNIPITKKNPSINDLNELLKQNDVIDIPQWRFIQHLADIRNLCDHNKKKEPTSGEINDLVNGVDKITKTIF